MEQIWIEAVTIVALGFAFVFLFLSALIGCIHGLYHLSPVLERLLPKQKTQKEQPPKQQLPDQSLKAKAIAAALAVHHQRMQSM